MHAQWECTYAKECSEGIGDLWEGKHIGLNVSDSTQERASLGLDGQRSGQSHKRLAEELHWWLLNAWLRGFEDTGELESSNTSA